MIKRIKLFEKKTALAFLVFVLALFIVGGLLVGRMGTLLNVYTESQVKKQAEVYGRLIEEKLNTSLDEMSYISSAIESYPEDIHKFMENIKTEGEDSWGLLTIDGSSLYGKVLLPQVFEGIQASFRGNRAISFSKGEGLLFTTPIFHGKNIKYVLYHFYPEGSIEDAFSLSCYEGSGKLCVVNEDRDIVIPFKDEEKEELSWFKSSEISQNFLILRKNMSVLSSEAKSFSTSRGRMILFEAEIKGSDYRVMGFVPERVASEEVGNISLLVVWVFGLLALLVLTGLIFIMNASVKLKESDELKAAKAEAEEASRAKSDFLANMSHEIRTPINAMLGMNEMILRESKEEGILEYAGNISSSGRTLLGLINDMLDFSEIEEGKTEIVPVSYELLPLVNELINDISPRVVEKDLKFKLDLDKAIPSILEGDDVRIKQAILNLLSNAVKYTEKGSVTLGISYDKVEGEPDYIDLKVYVRDTGRGIKEEDLSRLFVEFERLDEKLNRNIQGAGLGLSITKKLLEMMGSTLEVESTYGKGSVFSFSLRQRVINSLAISEAALKSSEDEKSKKEGFKAPTAEVLAVDDNRMNIKVFTFLLKSTLVNIDTAYSGEEGLRLCGKKKYDVIFLDHMMPNKDGIETLKELRDLKDNPNIDTPVVCLTANAVKGAREMYLEAGFEDYLSKPVDSKNLEEMLFKYIPKDKVV